MLSSWQNLSRASVRTALIKRKVGVCETKFSTSGQVRGNMRKQGSLFQISIQKCARNVKRPITTSNMALILAELVDSFAIAFCHPRRTHRLWVSCSVTAPHFLVYVMAMNYVWPVNCILPSFAVNRQWCHTFRSMVKLQLLLFGTLHYVAHIILLLFH